MYRIDKLPSTIRLIRGIKPLIELKKAAYLAKYLVRHPAFKGVMQGCGLQQSRRLAAGL
jgi:hypothetical protein